MNRPRTRLAGFLTALWLATGHAGAHELQVKAMPLPNQPPLDGAGSATVLTDQVLAPHPIWTQRSTAGWHRLTPVGISVALGAVGHEAPLSVRAHVAHYPKAGIFAPRRIDVYRGSEHRLHHVGSMTPVPNAGTAAGGSLWMDANVGGTGSHLYLVLHAARTSLFVDEIEIGPGAATASTAAAPDATLSIANAREDSLTRLRRQVSQDECLESGSGSATPFDARLTDVLGALPALHLGGEQTIDLHGIAGATQHVALGLYSDEPTSADITVSPHEDTRAISWYSAERVMSSSGRVTYDALQPITQLRDVRIPGGCARYLIAAIPFTGDAATQLTIDLRSGDGHKRRLTVVRHIHPAPPSLPEVAVNPFLYSSHAAQIGGSRALARAARDGVNVVVIARNHVPQPGTPRLRQRADAQLLRENLRLIGDDAMVLLALGWQRHQAPSVLKEPDEVQRREVLRAWSETLRDELRLAGVDDQRWALYVVDEPLPSEIEWVAYLLNELHRAQPRLLKYVTLATVPAATDASTLLSTAADTSTILQVEKGAAWALREPLRNHRGQWWIYSVPSEPAKDSSPIADHTFPSWLGWALGARGTGVWAYADVRNSSAWDDLDGITSDWSLVYERTGSTPIPSRRWLGYEQGVSDLRLLIAASARSDERPQCAEALRQARREIVTIKWGDTAANEQAQDHLAGRLRGWRTSLLRRCFE